MGVLLAAPNSFANQTPLPTRRGYSLSRNEIRGSWSPAERLERIGADYAHSFFPGKQAELCGYTRGAEPWQWQAMGSAFAILLAKTAKGIAGEWVRPLPGMARD